MFDSVHSAAAYEDGKEREEVLLRRVEEVIAPGYGVVEGALAVGEIERAAGEEGKAMLKTGEEGIGREEAQAGGGQFEGEGQTVQASAYFGYRSGVARREGETRFARPARAKL